VHELSALTIAALMVGQFAQLLVDQNYLIGFRPSESVEMQLLVYQLRVAIQMAKFLAVRVLYARAC
jgi:hypothetical protein